MKILFVTGGVPSLIGQAHVLDLIRVLSKSHQVTVVCCDLGTSLEEDAKEELRKISTVKCVRLRNKSLVRRGLWSLFSFTPIAVQGYCFDAMRNAVSDAAVGVKYDVAVFEQLVTAQYGYLVEANVKISYPVDAVSRLKWQRFGVAPNAFQKLVCLLDYRMTKRYENHIYREFDGVAFVSELEGDYAVANRQIDASKAFVIPLAIDTAYFAPGKSRTPDEASLVFLGNMGNYINEDAVLWFVNSVWERLKQAVPGIKFYVIGNKPTEKVVELGVKDPNIIVPGFLQDFRPPVWNATVFISPLRMGAGVKNRILQAMAMGKAIIASPATVDGVSVTEDVQVLVARDEEEWFRKCCALLNDPEERVRLGREARRFMEQSHSIEVKETKFIEIVEKIRRARNAI